MLPLPSIPLIAGMLVTGILIGLLSGLLGIGGGMQMIAIFKLCFHMAPIACTATSLFVVLFTSISGSISHIRNHTCLPKLGLAMGLGGAVLSPIGVNAANISPDWLIMCAAAVVVCYSAFTMFRKALAMKPAKAGGAVVAAVAESSDATGKGDGTTVSGAVAQMSQAATASAMQDAEFPTLAAKNYVQAVLIGMVAGFASGYIGVGGGFIMVPMMMTLIKMPMKLTSGTSLVAVMILAVPGVITQIMLGNVDWVVGIFVALGSIPGAVLGSKAVPYIPERTLRFAFGFLLIIVGVLLIVDQFGFLG